jgi:hypothetical protein
MVITSDGGYRGNKTIALKEIIDEALEKCTSIERVLVKRTNITMKEGRDIWLQPLLDEASDNSVAEIMDSEDPLFILYTSVRQENRKEWFTPPPVIWFIPLILLKMFSIMKKTISGVRLILVGLPVIIFCMAPY